MKKRLLFLFITISFFGYAQNWGEQIVTQANPSLSGFGLSTAINGDYAVVGAPHEDTQRGSATIYKRDVNGTWNELQKIQAYVGSSQDEYFGYSVAIQGDYIFVSALTDRVNEAQFQTPAGSVLIYKKDANDDWIGVQRIRSSDIQHSDHFGSSIAVDGDYLLVGAEWEDHDVNGNNSKSNAGSAYVFKKDANGVWNEVQKLVPSHRSSSNYIGRVVDISGDYIILGSWNKTDINDANPLSGNGSVFVFKKDGNGVWNETQKLKASDGASSSYFGTTGIAIDGEYMAVGAIGITTDQGNSTKGAVYLFKVDANGTWNENQKVITSLANISVNFGRGVSLDGNLMIATAPKLRGADAGGSTLIDTGGAFLFVKDANNVWIEAAQIATSIQEENAQVGGGPTSFGHDTSLAVGISGNYFILGAQHKDGVNVVNAGAAYLSGDVDALGLLSVLSVEENPFLTSVKAYPNPTIKNLHINLKENYTNVDVVLVNILGQTVLKKQFSNLTSFELNLNKVSKGLYLLKLTIDHKFTKTIKVIKK